MHGKAILSFVTTAISLLPLITDEISAIFGLSDDIRTIKNELERISAFLKSEEEKGVRDAENKMWIKQVTNLAYEIEDVIEKYQLYQKEGPFGKLQDYIHGVRNMPATIKSLRQKAVEIGKASTSQNATTSSSLYSQNMSCTMTFVQESELVGIEKSKSDIIKLLELNKMVAIVGMRGLGKTTVVHSVYNDLRVGGEFPICAWISASQTRDNEDILRSMMKQFYEADHERNQVINGVSSVAHIQTSGTNKEYEKQIDSMDPNSLENLIRKYINEKRYLLVFDNVENEYLEKATYVKYFLSKTCINNSKILMTTRHENVAHTWVDGCPQSIYQLGCLPYEKALELFYKKTFQSSHENSCPHFLKKLATGIVRRCGGLPPAILAMARLLSTMGDDLHEWEKVYNSLGFYLENNVHLSGVYEILINNYYDLRHNLQPCFLYFGMFPRGVPIKINKLIRLWVAEGFISKDRGSLTLEEIAEEDLKELIDMNVVKIEERDVDERPLTLRIHEFLHEIILSKAYELKFCQILSEIDSNIVENPRRLSLHEDSHKSGACVCLDRIVESKSSIRSLVIFKPSQDILSKVLHKNFLRSVHLLKVLDLCGAPIDDIPWQVGNLRNLRYLSLRHTRVQTLPSFIGKLQDLQTLDLKETQILKLPYEINKLHKLRHLFMYKYVPDFSLSWHVQKTIGIKLPKAALGNFKELQKLAFVDMSNGNSSMITSLENLTQLRRLGITGLKLKYGKYVCHAIQAMPFLQSLSVFSKNKREMIDLNHFHSPPFTLKRLYLNGPLGSYFPRWIFDLCNLVKLRLRWSNIKDFKSLENLHTLPNLVELHLLEAYIGSCLKFENEGFKKLKILQFLDLYYLKTLLIHEGAFPVLECFSIGESPKLQIPSGIKHLRGLNTLKFYNMPKDFNDSLQFGEEHYSIVQHIPEVLFHFKNSNIKGSWNTCTLRRS